MAGTGDRYYSPRVYQSVTRFYDPHYQMRRRAERDMHTGGGRSGRGRGRGAPSVPAGPIQLSSETFSWMDPRGLCPWVHLLKQMTVPTSLITVEPVCRCYLRTDSLLKLLGESVPFLKVILEKPEFIKLLGVESQATAEAMLRHLDALSRSSDLSVSKIVVRHSAVEPLTRRSAGLATHVSGPRIGTARVPVPRQMPRPARHEDDQALLRPKPGRAGGDVGARAHVRVRHAA